MNKKFLIISLLLGSVLTNAQELDSSDEYPVALVSPYELREVKRFSLTPSVNLLSVPHQLDGSLEMVFSEDFGIKYSQSLKTKGIIDNNNIDLDNKLIAVRTYPHRGPWFVSLGYGHHEIKVNRTDVINGFDTTTYAEIKSDYISPTTGFKWVYASGFSIGFEVGWMFALNSTTSLSSNQDLNPFVALDSDYNKHRQDAEDSISKYVSNGALTIGLFELGFTF